MKRTRRRADEAAPARCEVASFRPSEVMLAGVWFGLATGFLEMGGVLTSVKLLGRVTYDTLRTNWHYVWMTPLANLVVFAGLATLLWGVTLRIPRLRSPRLVIAVYAYVAAWPLVSAVPGLHKKAEVVLALGFACVATRFLVRRRAGFLRIVPRTAAAGAVLVAATAVVDVTTSAVDDGGGSATASPASPNVVLMVLDTVRADSLTPYGSERNATPNVAALAERGVLFKHARSTAPWTLPAHASLFTGRWPFELSADVGRRLDAEFPTLAEVLAERGYATAAFVANTQNCNAWYGLDRGFDRFEDFYENTTITPLETLRSARLGRYVATTRIGRSVVDRLCPVDFQYRKSAAMINRDALAWLSRHEDQPFFMFLNYFDVHDPYAPPAEAERRFSKPVGEAGSALDRARDAYDDCLAYLDDQIGGLLAELDARGELRNTLVIVTADHGEAFGEHGLSGHGVSLYRSELHIPLVLVHPSRTPVGLVVDRPVSLRDVAPTILDLLDLEKAPTFAGESLAKSWDAASEHRGEAAPVLSEVDRAGFVPDEAAGAPARLGRMRSLIADGRKYIVNGDGREELYDLHGDPDESNDLAGLDDVQEDLQQFRELMGRVTRETSRAE